MPSTLHRLLLTLALLLPATAHAQPANPAQAAAFVRQAGAELAVTVAGATSPEDRKTRLAAFLDRVVDEDGVARFCLGRYWQDATPAQQAEYTHLFRLLLLRGVVDRLGSYQAGATKITINTPIERADGIAVPTIVEKAGSKPVNISWLVVSHGGVLQIGDVQAEGVSLRLTERSDLSSFLAHHGGEIPALIAAMQQQTAQ